MLVFPRPAAMAIPVISGVALSSPWAVPTLADAAPNTATRSQATSQLREGDLVQLRSGGPVLTVKSLWHKWVICTSFDEYGTLWSAGFQIAMIVGPLSPDAANS
jgi:hypothetical protein